ncbi:hypothetical protein [Nocardioides aurantiacus]|uniref:Alternate signal-mediated exported protein n=1 Tax=Nocardioides aurantiacus TaxID=86796 RepID=A0A3N2CYX3_9ACTN|nr:hypothetical protein [Nocardioides aurantiacus]ROR92730.1 hypothetical protein EDD33_3629 [Nocardioides aurantiacus]
MKKLIVVPVVAVVAAVGAASAAGFAGGVSANPVQTGTTNDLTCATSAKVVEWGFRDDLAVPTVDTALVKLTGAQCSDQAVTVLWTNEDGSGKVQNGSNVRASGRVPAQGAGNQFVRLSFNQAFPAEELNSVRVSIDPGFEGQPYGTR